MLVSTDAPDFAAMGRTGNNSSEMITAMNETPLRLKHQAAPKFVSAIPPSAGPMTRARLNWMEFRAIAFDRSFGAIKRRDQCLIRRPAERLSKTDNERNAQDVPNLQVRQREQGRQ